MKKISILVLLLLPLFTSNSWAKKIHYRADVDGMVCAFCVYSVSKKISHLPGVIKDSVIVSLKNKYTEFDANKEISEKDLIKTFETSGFKISNLTTTTAISKKMIFENSPQFDLTIDVFELDRFTPVLGKIGDLIAKKDYKALIEAPVSQEESILLPLLMGRKQVIPVQFTNTNDSEKIHLQLFPLQKQ